MKALIKEKAARWGDLRTKYGKQVHEYLLANRGKWVEIETGHVFDNQYNTVDGYRIYDTDIERMTDDVRTETMPNAFFVQHPNGHDPIKEKFDVSHRDNSHGYYAAYAVNGLYYRISRRENIEFVLVGGVPYEVGIGYRKWKAPNQHQRKIMDNVLELINAHDPEV